MPAGDGVQSGPKRWDAPPPFRVTDDYVPSNIRGKDGVVRWVAERNVPGVDGKLVALTKYDHHRKARLAALALQGDEEERGFAAVVATSGELLFVDYTKR